MQIQTHEATAVISEKGIDVGKLEKELAAMWQEAGDNKGEGAGTGVTRACVLNLLVYAGYHEDRARIDALLDEVIEQNPCRAIILIVDRESGEAKLDAYVSTRCQVASRGAKQICGEQVTMEVSGPVLHTVATAIEPLLVPDVPVFLWWKDIPHYEDDLFNRMVAVADRVVIDSAAFDHPHEDLQRLAQIIRERPQFMRVSDLNWGRLTSWRTLIASFWDVPDYRPHLNNIDRVIVRYDPPDVAREQIAPQALLIVGWLASRLGWQVAFAEASKEIGVASFALQTDTRQIRVEMSAVADKEAFDGHIASLTLSSGEGDAEFHVALSRDQTKLETEARIGGERAVGRVLAYEAKTEGQRLSRELGFLSRDRAYEEAIAAVAQLLEKHHS